MWNLQRYNDTFNFNTHSRQLSVLTIVCADPWPFGHLSANQIELLTIMISVVWYVCCHGLQTPRLENGMIQFEVLSNGIQVINWIRKVFKKPSHGNYLWKGRGGGGTPLFPLTFSNNYLAKRLPWWGGGGVPPFPLRKTLSKGGGSTLTAELSARL